MPLDYSKTLWVRLYKDRRPKWRTLEWNARGLMSLILQEVDAGGRLELGEDAIAGIAQAIQAEPNSIRPYVKMLIDRGSICVSNDTLEIPNFESAQSAVYDNTIKCKTYRQRKKLASSREVRRDDSPKDPPPKPGMKKRVKKRDTKSVETDTRSVETDISSVGTDTRSVALPKNIRNTTSSNNCVIDDSLQASKDNESLLSYATSNNLSVGEVIGEILSEIPNLNPELARCFATPKVSKPTSAVSEPTPTTCRENGSKLPAKVATPAVSKPTSAVSKPTPRMSEPTPRMSEPTPAVSAKFRSNQRVDTTFATKKIDTENVGTDTENVGTDTVGSVSTPKEKKRIFFSPSGSSPHSGSVTLEIFFTKNQLLVKEPDPDFKPPSVEWIVGGGTRVRGASLVPLLEARLHAAGIKPDRRLVSGTAVDLGRRMVDWASRGALDLADWNQIAAMAESFADCWAEALREGSGSPQEC